MVRRSRNASNAACARSAIARSRRSRKSSNAGGSDMKITFVATRKNSDRTERELYEMDLLIRVLGFKRSFMDLGIQTVMACTPREATTALVDEYFGEIDYDVDTDLIALS